MTSNLFGLLITRDDDLLVRQWFARHAKMFEKLAVLDGSSDPLTRDVALTYGNVIYSKDPEGSTQINDQTLRSACWGMLDPYVTDRDWVVVCHCDEFFYHSPLKIIEKVADEISGVTWQALHILPHLSEKPALMQDLEETGTYDPIERFKHFWYRRDPQTNKISATREYRMFKVPPYGVKWGNSNSWVLPVNLIGKTATKKWKGGSFEFNRPITFDPAPTFLHYKLYNIDITQFIGSSGVFAKSRLNTGISRPVSTLDDCFFGAESPWKHKNHVLFEKFLGRFPDDHIFNRLGNSYLLE